MDRNPVQEARTASCPCGRRDGNGSGDGCRGHAALLSVIDRISTAVNAIASANSTSAITDAPPVSKRWKPKWYTSCGKVSVDFSGYPGSNCWPDPPITP